MVSSSFPRIMAVLMIATTGLVFAEEKQPFGDEKAVAYAEKLWRHLTDLKLVGENRTMSAPYEGVHPHGAFLDTIERSVTFEDNTGPVLIKRNYRGDDLTKREVWNNPDKHLELVTVMYQRGEYDPENNNWFWASFLPDGSLDTNPKGVKLAGRVGADEKAGCIACHRNAPGGDMVYAHDRYAADADEQ